MIRFFIFAAILPLICLTPELGEAETPPAQALAQYSNDENFDPFADYSEFEESEEEETDVNFFKNGRFFTLGFLFGQNVFTETLGEITQPGFGFGAYLSYFFDLRFAMQFSFTNSSNNFDFTTPNNVSVQADSTISTFGFSIKYYLNTQNVTKGLADLNPYIFTGFSQVSRTASSGGNLDIAKEGAMGFDIGAGIEVPVLKNKMYVGFQTAFHLISFKNESSEIVVGTENTNIFPTGDMVSILGVMGVNF